MSIRAISFHRVILGIAIIAGCQKEKEQIVNQERADEPVEDQVLTGRKNTKALFPNALWLETKHSGLEFMFCANDLPAYGNSIIEVHGWVYRQHSRQWERIFNVTLIGMGRVALSVDSKSGVFVVKGTANNKLLDQSVFILDLRTAMI